MLMRAMKNEHGRWEVAFAHTDGLLADVGFAFEPDSPDFATRAEADKQAAQWHTEMNADRAACQQYMFGC